MSTVRNTSVFHMPSSLRGALQSQTGRAMDVTQSPSPSQARRRVNPSTVALPVFEIVRLAPIGVKRTTMFTQDTSGLRALRLRVGQAAGQAS
jgi:hypothetical protein